MNEGAPGPGLSPRQEEFLRRLQDQGILHTYNGEGTASQGTATFESLVAELPLAYDYLLQELSPSFEPVLNTLQKLAAEEGYLDLIFRIKKMQDQEDTVPNTGAGKISSVFKNIRSKLPFMKKTGPPSPSPVFLKTL